MVGLGNYSRAIRRSVGAIRLQGRGKGRDGDGAMALRRGGEVELVVAVCPLPEGLGKLRWVLQVALMVSEVGDS